ncbi:MAG: glycosyltransferase [Candidatus Thorarchaeota archaeon]|jgi:glycosyltransferase involved in cell wall biosynthesis
MSKILYIAPVRDFSGYAVAARGYIRALHEAGADLVVRPVRYDQADPGTAYQPTDLERELLKRDLNNVDIVIQHVTPNEMRPVAGKINIAVVAWETTRIPAYWVEKLNRFDAVITFCDASVVAFRECGVTVPIHKVPHTFDIPGYSLDGVDPIVSPNNPDILKDRFVFYNISQFASKKGVDLLLRSYYGAFHGCGDDVMLIIKTYINMGARENEQLKLQQYIQGVKAGMRLPQEGYPPVMLITKTLTDEQIKKIHATGDAYVCSSRGEGWCIPAFEALTYGKKLVTTDWGGMGEFTILRNENGNHVAFDANYRGPWHKPNVYPVKYSMEPLVGQTHADPELYTGFDLIAEPSVSSMMAQMKLAIEHRNVEEPAPNMMEFDHSTVGPNMLKLIEEVEITKTQEVTNV